MLWPCSWGHDHQFSSTSWCSDGFFCNLETWLVDGWCPVQGDSSNNRGQETKRGDVRNSTSHGSSTKGFQSKEIWCKDFDVKEILQEISAWRNQPWVRWVFCSTMEILPAGASRQNTHWWYIYIYMYIGIYKYIYMYIWIPISYIYMQYIFEEQFFLLNDL